MAGLQIKTGNQIPFGCNLESSYVHFSIHLHAAIEVILEIFDEKRALLHRLSLDPLFHRTGSVWHVALSPLPSRFLYGYRLRREGGELSSLLLDPYAKWISAPLHWNDSNAPSPRFLSAFIPPLVFDWEGILPPRIPKEKLAIYEMHIRGFTQDPSSGVSLPGTFSGMIEKIAYLKELNINAVELLPILEFDETEPKEILKRHSLCNYWGYSPLSFFIPMTRYAAGKEIESAPFELKLLVRELHRADIEVYLDLVFNHTGEGDEIGPTLHFKELDRAGYYLLHETGGLCNFSGCGNSVNANHPVVLELIIDSLRHLVQEYHIDGFRFDLASALKRKSDGSLAQPSPLLEAIAKDPLLADCKFFAEPWDAVGVYEVGRFYPDDRFSEWNGFYRDTIRSFLKGDSHKVSSFATALCGSPSLYHHHNTPLVSLNFITCHDGFSLHDLVSYERKHNEANGEENRDGTSVNESWNCGMEGATDDPFIREIRLRQMKNMLLALFLSQGIPMIAMGDEYGHTKGGNNNSWCQDSRMSWFQWDRARNHPLQSFMRRLIAIRQRYAILHKSTFFTEREIRWHGLFPHQPDWSPASRRIAFTLIDETIFLYGAFNADSTAARYTLPELREGELWRKIILTSDPSSEEEGEAIAEPSIELPPYSALLIEGKR